MTGPAARCETGLFEDKMSENYSDYGISGWALDLGKDRQSWFL